MFLVFEVLFYGFLEVFSERTQALFPFWAVVSANTLAAVCMGVYLWRRHPAFRQSIHDTPLGAAPRTDQAVVLSNRSASPSASARFSFLPD